MNAQTSTTPTTTPRSRRKLLGVPVWIVIGAIVAIFAVGGYILGGPRRDRFDNIGKVSVCEALGDPANADLSASDWWRIENSRPTEVIAYVTEHCPWHLSQVR